MKQVGYRAWWLVQKSLLARGRLHEVTTWARRGTRVRARIRAFGQQRTACTGTVNIALSERQIQNAHFTSFTAHRNIEPPHPAQINDRNPGKRVLDDSSSNRRCAFAHVPDSPRVVMPGVAWQNQRLTMLPEESTAHQTNELLTIQGIRP